MDLNPERRMEAEEYAKLHCQSPEEALDDLLAEQLEWKRRDYAEAVDGIRRGLEDMKAGAPNR